MYCLCAISVASVFDLQQLVTEILFFLCACDCLNYRYTTVYCNSSLVVTHLIPCWEEFSTSLISMCKYQYAQRPQTLLRVKCFAFITNY